MERLDPVCIVDTDSKAKARIAGRSALKNYRNAGFWRVSVFQYLSEKLPGHVEIGP